MFYICIFNHTSYRTDVVAGGAGGNSGNDMFRKFEVLCDITKVKFTVFGVFIQKLDVSQSSSHGLVGKRHITELRGPPPASSGSSSSSTCDGDGEGLSPPDLVQTAVAVAVSVAVGVSAAVPGTTVIAVGDLVDVYLL
jgi:hypothetical protein